jgi:hypothetical protein
VYTDKKISIKHNKQNKDRRLHHLNYDIYITGRNGSQRKVQEGVPTSVEVHYRLVQPQDTAQSISLASNSVTLMLSPPPSWHVYNVAV